MNEEAPPPIDFPAPEQPPMFEKPAAPIAQPSPVAAPAWNGPAKQTLKSGEPVTQETYTKQTISRGVQAVMPTVDHTGVARRDIPAVEFLAQIYIDPKCSSWTVQVDRIGPPKWDGITLLTGPVEIISPPIPYPDVQQRVKELHGGGKYVVRVINEDGVLQKHFPFNIDTMQYAPIPVRAAALGGGYRSVDGMSRMGGVGAAFQNGLGNDAGSELQKLREAEALVRASKSLKLAELDAEETTETITQRRRLRQEQDERRTQGASMQQLNESTRIETLLREMAHANDRRMDQMQQNFEKFMMLSMQPKKDDSMAGMMMVFAKMFESMGNNQVALMAAMRPVENKNGLELKDILQLTTQSNEKVSQLAMSNAAAMMENFKSTSSKNDKLLEQLIISKIEHPENAVKQALELREAGWKQAVEMMEMRNGNEPEDVINPENGFFSNLGNVILSTLQGFASNGAKGAGKQLMSTLANAMQKPPGQPFSQAELVQAARVMERNELASRGVAVPPLAPPVALPQPQPGVVRPQQAQRPRVDPRRIFNYVFETEAASVAAAPVPAPAPTPTPMVEQQPGLVPVPTEEVEIQESVAAAPLAPEQTSSLQEYVTRTMEIMLSDLRANRNEHEWVDFALAKWDEAFLLQFAQAPDDGTRVVMLRDLTAPAVYAQVEELLLSNQSVYEKFLANLQDLVADVLEPETANA